MSDLIDTAESNSQVTGVDDADLESCRSCGEPLAQPGIDGSCPKCLLVQPFAGMWDPREPPSAEEVAEALPRFKIEKELGRGALGAVYGAIDTSLNRIVAIKAMVANPENPEFTARFECEASAMAKLNHPNIVAIYDSGIVDDMHYIVMERMDGGTLQQEIQKKKRLPVRRAIAILGQICDALDYVHSRNVIHRDVKPGNILLDRHGNAKLSDFGLVKGLRFEEFNEVALTRTDMAVGTPLYMAPEQLEWPTQADHRADIYSAGAVLYEMMTGEVPSGRHKAISKFPGVPRFLNAVVDQALNKVPEKRYERALSLKQHLLRRQGATRRRLLRLCTAAGVGLLALGGAVAIDFQRTPDRQGVGNGVAIPQEAIDGLLLGNFADEINLDDWYRLADYDFARGPADDTGNQEDLRLDVGATVEDGMLRLSEFDDLAVSNLKRTWSTVPKALAVNFRFLPEAYLAPAMEDAILFEFSLHWKQGVFLQNSKWGDPLPTFQIERRQPMAPPGVIEPKLAAGQWHDVWIVMSDSYRLWIDGIPVYRTRESAGLDNWERWKGDQGVTLQVQGFRGQVDYIRVWEQK